MVWRPKGPWTWPWARGPGSPYRALQSFRFLVTRDRRAVLEFLSARYPIPLSATERIALLGQIFETTHAVRGYHSLEEILTVMDRILARGGQAPVVVEAGVGKGASTAKLSLAVALAGGRLVAFDSFRGIPENDEVHEHLDGRTIVFRSGAFLGRLGSVRNTVARFGAPEVVRLEKGLFEESLPRFHETIDVALLDVDLLSSTRTCLRWLFPRLRPGGVLFTQDGHLKAIIQLLGDSAFWRDEIGVPRPRIDGLGTKKLLQIRRA